MSKLRSCGTCGHMKVTKYDCETGKSYNLDEITSEILAFSDIIDNCMCNKNSAANYECEVKPVGMGCNKWVSKVNTCNTCVYINNKDSINGIKCDKKQIPINGYGICSKWSDTPDDVITWDMHFMSLVSLIAMRSKDPNTKVGAVIVDKLNRIISTGYNGFPRMCDEREFTWSREGEDESCTKYPYVVHAELNAILSARRDLTDCTIYVDLFPCSSCVKAIIQSGIGTVKYSDDKYINTPNSKAAIHLLNIAEINIERVDGYDITINKKINNKGIL